MLWFIVQLALLLLAAYFAGAMLGCVVRRTFFPHTLSTARAARPVPAAPMPATIPAAAAQQTRFERALTGSNTTTTAPSPVPPQPQTPPPPKAPPAPQAPVSAAPASPAASPAATSAAVSAAMTAVAAAARAQQQTGNILPAAVGTTGPGTVAAPIAPVQSPPPTASALPPAAAPAAAPPAAPAEAAQDLTRIRAVDEAMQKALYGLGVNTFANIAGWKPGDVARVAEALKIPGRIEQENWIEQAQILAKGGETYYSRRKLKGELPSARPTPDEGERITVRVPAAMRPTAEPAAQAPAAAPAPAAPPAPSVAAEAVAAAAAAAVQAAQAAVSSAAAPAATATAAKPAATEPAASAASDRPIGMARDALQRIAGINAEVERLLNVQGVTRYAQIASWTPSDIARFDRLLGFEGRIARENWIEQAQILASGGETAYARDFARRAAEASRPAKLADAIQAARSAEEPAATAPAAAPAPDLSTLRSVRSEAYRGPDAGAPASGAARAVDDLKRIRGVGVLIEKKLNALGVSRYDQIANWTQGDIDRFSEKLDFKGRIERENWVEQARILSAGGQTEFSQRVDRGEVETSKPRT